MVAVLTVSGRGALILPYLLFPTINCSRGTPCLFQAQRGVFSDAIQVVWLGIGALLALTIEKMNVPKRPDLLNLFAYGALFYSLLFISPETPSPH